jgi:hypothetical protein
MSWFVSLGAGLKPDELLVPPVGSPHITSQVDHTPMVMPGIVVGGAGSLFNSPSPPSVHQQGHGGHRKRKKSLPPSHPPSSSRASIVFPILASNPFTAAASQKKFDADQGIGKVSRTAGTLWKDVMLNSTAMVMCFISLHLYKMHKLITVFQSVSFLLYRLLSLTNH